MKIGIVTWHKGNIGGTLQAYALSEVLKNMGHTPELINLIDNRHEIVIRKLRNFLFHVCFIKSGLTRDYTYKFIKENANETTDFTYNDLKEYAKCYDAVICGSDQIWSCVKGVDPFYFLQFVEADKRIAYAPSIGLNGIKTCDQKIFSEFVQSIPYLSIREEKGAEIIKELTGLKPKVVLDPTLLLKKDDWLSLANGTEVKKFGLKKDGYILCYYLGDFRKYTKYTEALAKKNQKRIVYISFKRRNFGINQIVCSIEEFLALVRDANCILTDSFHGTIVPMNIGKKVAVFERFSNDDPMNQNSRIYSILSKVQADKWITNPQDAVESFIKRKDDYDSIQSKLDEERKLSLSFLKESLSDICNRSFIH